MAILPSAPIIVLLYFALFAIGVTSGALYSYEHSDDRLILFSTVQDQGILTLLFDPSKPASQSLEIIRTDNAAGSNPQWVTQYGTNVYSVSRQDFSVAYPNDGGIFAFARDWEWPWGSSSLKQLDAIESGGNGGVFCDFDKPSSDGSTVSIHPRFQNGALGDASYTFKYTLEKPGPGTNGSQIQSNPHESMFDPSGEYMFVPDRGADRLYVYHVCGPLSVTQILTLEVEPGTGPRHLTFRVFNDTRTYMYLVSELDNSVRVFTLDGVDNKYERNCEEIHNITVTLTQRISTLGANLNRTAPDNKNLAAEVALSNDGRFAYVANRNAISYSSDTLAIYAVNPGLHDDRNHLTYLGYNLTFGKTPRHFSLSKDPQTRYVAIGNEVSNTIVILERDAASGFFTSFRGNLTLGSFDVTTTTGPTCVIWT
ncbi:hypothetical protein OIDMADRAFT_29721 [Oidiodendron maius Zn]|uniref:3-carboxymuconate cyclase n=1 Tax=Oidiodendron maius (strain Zn) TaxID=913774 RepID=A0A0C3CNS7_OIDMZ|nr:hypothetical protein OIDMADRAFT_29721 [Oidiodendron maius Zn]